MVSIEISIGEDEAPKVSLRRDNILVGWRNLLREEQLALLKELSNSFFDGQRNLNEE